MRPRLGTDIISATCTSRQERKPQMRQIRHTRRRPGPASEQQSPLPADPRDPDIVHAHQVARRRHPPPTPSAPVAGRSPRVTSTFDRTARGPGDSSTRAGQDWPVRSYPRPYGDFTNVDARRNLGRSTP